MPPHIVLLGAGFGGVYTAKELLPVVRRGAIRLTIINHSGHFLFTPLLHEVATGSLSPSSVVEPLREIFARTNVRIVTGDIGTIDRTARTVTVRHGSHTSTLTYDRLIIATGAETAYHDIPGAREHTLPLKTLEDAERMRRTVIDRFEEALLCPHKAEHEDLLSFTVVGGGATGVETIAELAEFVHGIARRYSTPDAPLTPHLTLLHSGAELLEPFPPALRATARKRLEAMGISVCLNCTVTAVTPEGVTLADSDMCRARTVIWTAGVMPAIPPFTGEQPTLMRGRLALDGYFRLVNDERIFALGDVAAYNSGADTQPLPTLAQVAVAEARVVAHNVCASLCNTPLTTFTFHSKGALISMGNWFAMGDIYGLRCAGAGAWWLWRTVYLWTFASWRKRFRIAFEWTINLFYPRDIS